MTKTIKFKAYYLKIVNLITDPLMHLVVRKHEILHYFFRMIGEFKIDEVDLWYKPRNSLEIAFWGLG